MELYKKVVIVPERLSVLIDDFGSIFVKFKHVYEPISFFQFEEEN